ncbi:hypothetical protein QW71_35935 [Paenibacillus sp. IHB B 3415]|uniref:hypothetical protein n=1 Tax=Paenibacillus sp. IHB B 3415 TaxID=867080 RepID=UPI0005746C49|nr:hypothetical protein [Paenibacillus sp. IHB B 3415]KHL91218.1 hypothetical protein QW71_35935 [Paenibacillus sp. IHB B 3415]
MDVFVYFKSKQSYSRDEIEEAIEEILETRGEVTGSGSGTNGSNLDIEIYDESDDEAVEQVKKVLRQMKVTNDTTIVVKGVRFNLYP